MKYRTLTEKDCFTYRKDIIKCYKDCHLIFDSQSPIPQDYEYHELLRGFVNAKDSLVYGIFDSDEYYLYGIVIFDNIRIADKSGAEVHIVTDKAIWGKKIKNIYGEMLQGCIFDTLYCQIPTIAVHTIALCKRLGFKKTGYIPDILPYVNAKGEEKMYDLQIYTYRR